MENQKSQATFPNARIYLVENKKAVVLEATNNFIPFNEFKSIFEKMEEMTAGTSVDTLVFDKSKLTVFHQPSMEWYFTIWKEKMYYQGLRKHRKILPDDKFFRYSVEIGRKKIDEKYPEAKYHQMDIQYVDSVEAGLDS